MNANAYSGRVSSHPHVQTSYLSAFPAHRRLWISLDRSIDRSRSPPALDSRVSTHQHVAERANASPPLPRTSQMEPQQAASGQAADTSTHNGPRLLSGLRRLLGGGGDDGGVAGETSGMRGGNRLLGIVCA